MSELANLQVGIDGQPARSGANVVVRALEDIKSHAENTMGVLRQMDGALAQAGSSLRRIGAFTGISASIAQLVEYSDNWINLSSRMRIATKDSESFLRAQRDLFAVSQQTRSSFEAAVVIYQRLARSSRDLSLSANDIVRVTRTLNEAMQISGGSTRTQAAALIQLSQALASGVLRGDELRSVLEQAPRITDVLADHLKVSAGEIYRLGKEGKITAQILVDALLSQADAVDKEFTKFKLTVGASLTQLSNSVLAFVGRLNQSTGVFGGLANAIHFVALNFESLARAASVFLAAWAAQKITPIVVAFSAWATRQADVIAAVASGRAVMLNGAEAARQKAAAALAAAEAVRKLTLAELDNAKATLSAIELSRVEAFERLRAAQVVTQRAARTPIENLSPLGGKVVAEEIALRQRAYQQEAAAIKELAVLGRQQASVQAQITAATAASTAATTAAAGAATAHTAALGRMSVAARIAATAQSGLNSVIAFFGGPVGATITALTVAYFYLSSRVSAAEKVSRDYGAAMDDERRKTDELTLAINRQAIARGQKGSLEGTNLQESLNTAKQLQAAIKSLVAAAVSPVNTEFAIFGASAQVPAQLKALSDSLVAGSVSAEKFREKVVGLRAAFPNFGVYAKDILENTNALIVQEGAIAKDSTALRELEGNTSESARATRIFAEMQKRAADAAQEHAQRISALTGPLQANTKALEDAFKTGGLDKYNKVLREQEIIRKSATIAEKLYKEAVGEVAVRALSFADALEQGNAAAAAASKAAIDLVRRETDLGDAIERATERKKEAERVEKEWRREVKRAAEDQIELAQKFRDQNDKVAESREKALRQRIREQALGKQDNKYYDDWIKAQLEASKHFLDGMTTIEKNRQDQMVFNMERMLAKLWATVNGSELSRTGLRDIQRAFSSIFTTMLTDGKKAFGDLFTYIRESMARLAAAFVGAKLGPKLLGAFDNGPLDISNIGNADFKPGLTTLGKAALGAGIGFAAGSVGGAGLGVLAGGVGGFAAGGPVGAVVGAVAGLVSGLFGESAKARAAAEKMRQAQIAFRSALDDFVAIAHPRGALADSLKKLEDQARELQRAAEESVGGVDKARQQALGRGDVTKLTVDQIQAELDRLNKLKGVQALVTRSGKEYLEQLLKLRQAYDDNVAAAKKQFEQQQKAFTEDLEVRSLTARGLTEEAAARRDALAAEREFAEAVKTGYDASTLAILGNVLALEQEANARQRSIDAINKAYGKQAAGFTLSEAEANLAGDKAGALQAAAAGQIADVNRRRATGELTMEEADRWLKVIAGQLDKSLQELADEAEAAATALFKYNRVLAEDLAVRELLALATISGTTADAERAEQLRRTYEKQRETDQAIADGATDANLAFLAYVQGLEDQAIAVEKLRRQEEELQRTREFIANAMADLRVRELRAQGNEAGADDLTRRLQRDKTIADLIANNASQADIDYALSVFQQEQQKADRDRLAAQQAAFDQATRDNTPVGGSSPVSDSATSVNLAVGISESTAGRIAGLLTSQMAYQASLPRIETILLRIEAVLRACHCNGVDPDSLNEDLGGISLHENLVGGFTPGNN